MSVKNNTLINSPDIMELIHNLTSCSKSTGSETINRLVFHPNPAFRCFHLLVSGSQLGGPRLLIIGSFTISAIEYVFGGGRSVTFLPRFLPFIGYFLAGHYLLVHPNELKAKINTPDLAMRNAGRSIADPRCD